MFHRLNKIGLATVATVAIIAAMAGPASARVTDAARSSTRAASNSYVDITGTISWKQVYTPPGWTGGQVTTGTFKVNLTKKINFPTEIVANSSTYSIADNTNQKYVNGPCTRTTTGNHSASGSLKLNALPAIGWYDDLPYQKDAGVFMNIPYAEKQTTTTTGPAACNPGTTTMTLDEEASPSCLKHQTPLPVNGVFKGTYPRGTINVGCAGTFTGNGTTSYSIAGNLSLTTPCVPPDQLSGPSWISKFPDSSSLSDLSGTFRQDVTRFIPAMQHAGITVGVLDTLRPPERAYLMHYSWLIAKLKVSPPAVPAFTPGPGQASVNICWVHTDANGSADLPASITAAQDMVSAYHIDPNLAVPPALKSLHTMGLAIDMTTTWSKSSITIVNANGHSVTISSGPHNGLNSTLIATGATYGVIHFLNAAKDPNHWSVNGH